MSDISILTNSFKTKQSDSDLLYICKHLIVKNSIQASFMSLSLLKL